MRRAKLSQVDLFSVVRTRNDMAIITLLDNVEEVLPTNEDEQISYLADMYQLRLPWREGIDDPDQYAEFLARAKELEDPQTDADRRIARDILIS